MIIIILNMSDRNQTSTCAHIYLQQNKHHRHTHTLLTGNIQIYQAIYLFVCLFVYLPVCLCIYLSIYLPIYLSVYLSFYLSIYLFNLSVYVCRSVSVSTFLSFCLSIDLPIFFLP